MYFSQELDKCCLNSLQNKILQEVLSQLVYLQRVKVRKVENVKIVLYSDQSVGRNVESTKRK